MRKPTIYCVIMLLLMASCDKGIMYSDNSASEQLIKDLQLADQIVDQLYYWSMGKKHYLDIDPHTIIIKSDADSTKIAALSSSISSDLIISRLNNDLFVLKSNKDFRDLAPQLSRDRFGLG